MSLTPEQAQRRADQIQAFRNELIELSEAGVLQLDLTQQQSIAGHHTALLNAYRQQFNTDTSQQAKQLSWAMRTASLVGALGMVASLWFMFYQWWDGFSPWAQHAVVLIATLTSLGFCALLKQRKADGYFTKMAATFALACFALNTWVLGQIYNLAPSAETALLWGLYGLALAYYSQASLLLVAALACLGAYLSFCLARLAGFAWHQAWEMPELWLIAAAGIFAAAFMQRSERFARGYRALGTAVFLASLLLLSMWGDASFLSLPRFVIENLYVALTLLASGAGLYLGTLKLWSEVRLISSISLVSLLIIKAFDWFWDLLPPTLFFMLISLVAVLILISLKKLRARTGEPHAH